MRLETNLWFLILLGILAMYLPLDTVGNTAMVTRFGDAFVFVFLVSGTLGVNFYTQTIGCVVGFACNSHWLLSVGVLI
jgi:hypothetical protein